MFFVVVFIAFAVVVSSVLEAVDLDGASASASIL